MSAMLSALGQTVRQHDPDRFLCALFANDARREALFTLYAFNHELARAGEVASEPGLALIRLQWWREVVEGAPRRHVVATQLHEAIAAGALHAEELLDMIAMREAEIDIPTVEAWQQLQMQGPGALAVAAGRALGAEDALLPRLRRLGAGYGAAGSLRNFLAGRGQVPADVAALAPHGLALLGKPHQWPHRLIAAALPAVLARRDLARLPAFARRRGITDRIAVAVAALRSVA